MALTLGSVAGGRLCTAHLAWFSEAGMECCLQDLSVCRSDGFPSGERTSSYHPEAVGRHFDSALAADRRLDEEPPVQ